MIRYACGTCGSRSIRAEYDMHHEGLWSLWCFNNHRIWGHAGFVITIQVPTENDEPRVVEREQDTPESHQAYLDAWGAKP